MFKNKTFISALSFFYVFSMTVQSFPAGATSKSDSVAVDFNQSNLNSDGQDIELGEVDLSNRDAITPEIRSHASDLKTVEPVQQDVAIDMGAVGSFQLANELPLYDCDDIFYDEDRSDIQNITTVDPGFLASIFNMKEVVLPFTARKAAFWCGFAVIGGGIAALEKTVGFSQPIVDAVNYNSTALTVLLYGLEPFFSLIDLFAAQYPDAAPIPDPANREDNTGDIALVIPAHNSSSIIKKTLNAALRHLRPEQIFVVDNGSSEHPTDDTREKIRSLDPKINYIWQGIPNKNVAQYAGAVAAARQGYKFIMTTDDDVTLPKNFDFCTREINEDVKGVCFPIRAVSASDTASILVNWQDIEYQAADLGKMAEDRFCGAQYPHGAGSLWDTDTFLEILKDHHDTIFYAEDMKLGFGLAEVGKRMVMCSSVILDTDAPTSIIGKKPNFWQQRVRSWEMTRHAMFGKSLIKLISPFSKVKSKTAFGVFIKKKSQLTLVLSTAVDWIRLPVTLILATNSNAWVKFGIISSLSAVPPLLLNYAGPLSNRPDLKCKLGAILTYPIYKLIYAGLSAASGLRAVFIYLPNLTKVPTIRNLEENRDPRCVWLQDDPIMQPNQPSDVAQ